MSRFYSTEKLCVRHNDHLVNDFHKRTVLYSVSQVFFKAKLAHVMVTVDTTV